MNAKKILSVNTEESVVVVEDFGSSQDDSVLQVAGPGGREFSRNFSDVPVETLQRSEEKARLKNPESVRIKTACVAANLGVQLSVLCRDLRQFGCKGPMPRECAAITADDGGVNKRMWLGAVPRCIVIWNLRASPSKSP